MPLPCSVCSHDEREVIDAALVGGQANRAMARQFGVSKDAVARHRAHISPALARVVAEREEAGPRSALAQLERLSERATAILDAAEQEGRATVGLSAIRELRGLVELMAKLTGELDERPVTVINLAESAEWVQLRGLIMAALAPHPAAAQAVAAAIEAGPS